MTIFEKNIFKTLLQGIPNFEARIFMKYTYQKKNKNSFEIPWLRAIKCLLNQNFMKHVLENRKKMLHPNVHILQIYFLIGNPGQNTKNILIKLNQLRGILLETVQ